jgi:hypothetical protein
LSNKTEIIYWGFGVGLLSVLESFSIDVKYSLEASIGCLIPKKDKQIHKVQGDKWIKF